MPDMTQKLNMIIMDPNIQWNIYNDSRAEVTRNKETTPNITKAVKQFEAMFMYTSALRYGMNKGYMKLIKYFLISVKFSMRWRTISKFL